MKQVIQHILFPDDDSLYDYWLLYYRGNRGRITGLDKNSYYCLAKYCFAEFNTYLNGVSYGKWKKYTGIGKVSLHLELRGDVEVILTGYTLVKHAPVRTALGRYHISNSERREVVFDYPENKQMMLGFELSAISDVEMYGGYYEADFPEETGREVELAIATTTFKKEEYIKKNTRRLLEGLFDRYPEIHGHIRMHVVDNGRTLKRDDLPADPRFELHPNPNAGGSGGYARGMLECMHQTPEATHVLLMDDDIMILPESIFRTYQLLRFLKTEYYSFFVSGAMMVLEEKNIQHEDFGKVWNDGYLGPVKPSWNHFSLTDNLNNELEYLAPNSYQGWWYCCIPADVIRKNGLPLPLFIRGDDVEYSLRCGARFISMNGICLWHMGFYGKYNASMSIYQEFRNLWIDQATTGVLSDVDLMNRFKKNFRANLLKHDYISSEMALRAFEDFLKGPKFIMENRGEEIVRENSKMNEKMVPYEDVPVKNVDFKEDPYYDESRRLISTFLYRATFNGHLFWPEKLLSKKPVLIPFDYGYTPGKMAMHETYIAVNPEDRTAAVRKIDKAKFRELELRYLRDMQYYKKYGDRIRSAYRENRDYLVSEDFWNKYLGIK